MLHLIVPFKKPLVIKDFVSFNNELQAVCDKYGMGEILLYLGKEKKEDDRGKEG